MGFAQTNVDEFLPYSIPNIRRYVGWAASRFNRGESVQQRSRLDPSRWTLLVVGLIYQTILSASADQCALEDKTFIYL